MKIERGEVLRVVYWDGTERLLNVIDVHGTEDGREVVLTTEPAERKRESA